ncbi:MAG: PleD family two-component system response regulator [Thiobacillus sp.]
MGLLDRLRAAFIQGKAVPTPVTETQPPREERRKHARRNARADTRALIVDDSPTIVFSLKKILQSAGFITLEAGDAETGLKLARTELPDLIFLDIILPSANGFAALRALRKDPATAHIPVIMISGNEQATELFFGSRIGADDFMKKPFSRYEVFARIERLLDENMVPRRLSTFAPDTVSTLPD